MKLGSIGSCNFEIYPAPGGRHIVGLQLGQQRFDRRDQLASRDGDGAAAQPNLATPDGAQHLAPLHGKEVVPATAAKADVRRGGEAGGRGARVNHPRWGCAPRSWPTRSGSRQQCTEVGYNYSPEQLFVDHTHTGAEAAAKPDVIQPAAERRAGWGLCPWGNPEAPGCTGDKG